MNVEPEFELDELARAADKAISRAPNYLVRVDIPTDSNDPLFALRSFIERASYAFLRWYPWKQWIVDGAKLNKQSYGSVGTDEWIENVLRWEAGERLDYELNRLKPEMSEGDRAEAKSRLFIKPR